MSENTPNTSAMASPFKTLVKGLFQISSHIDQQLTVFRQDANDIREYYAPRAEFERWRDSLDGKAWKKQQYYRQNGCCAICKEPILYKGSHIDHIKPISKNPKLNLDQRNMRITCPTCNTSKGSKDD